MIGRMLPTFALISAMTLSAGAFADEGQKEADDQLQKLLDEANVFYKPDTSDETKAFIVLMNDDDGSSEVVVMAEQIGSIGDKPVYGYRAFTIVAAAPEGESMPPDVIKLVGKVNRHRPLGFYGTTDDMRGIIGYATGMLDGTTARNLSMNLFYVHRNKVYLRKEIESVLKGSTE